MRRLRAVILFLMTCVAVISVSACGSDEPVQADTAVPSSAWQQKDQGTERDARGLSDCKNKITAISLSRNEKNSAVSATGWGTSELRLEFDEAMSILNVIAGDANGTQGSLGRSLDPSAMEVVGLKVDEFSQNGLIGTAPETFSWIRLCQ